MAAGSSRCAASRFEWASPGAIVAALLWLVGSIVFSLYVNNFGSYNETYGALAGVVVSATTAERGAEAVRDDVHVRCRVGRAMTGTPHHAAMH